MLKLLKYEFRRERNYLLILSLLITAVFILFAFEVSFNKELSDHVFIAFVTVILLTSWDAHLIISMVKFRNDINSKKSELTFTLPRSGAQILLSKMIAILGELILIYLICIIFAGILKYIFSPHSYEISKTDIACTSTLIYNVINNLAAFILIISAGFLSILIARSSKSKGVIRTIVTAAIFIAIMAFSICIIIIAYSVIPEHHVISDYGIKIISLRGVESTVYVFIAAAVLFMSSCNILNKHLDI